MIHVAIKQTNKRIIILLTYYNINSYILDIESLLCLIIKNYIEMKSNQIRDDPRNGKDVH